MRRRTTRLGLVLLLASSVNTASAWTAGSAQAAASKVIVEWQMNEPPGSTTMLDSSGNGINGSIGSAVMTGATFNGATGYRWAFASPSLPPAKPERIVEASDGRLNPGTGDYAVTVRYRTIQPFGNILQKGQGGAPGGYYKLENPGGVFTCVFRGVGPSGFQRKEVNSGTPLNDGQWHTVRCERIGNQLLLTVDGTLVSTSSGSTGSINNPRPISIAGKINCDNIEITCDYFTGDIDWVRIEVPESVPDPTPGNLVFSDDFSSGNYSAWTSTRNMAIDGSQGDAAPPSARANTVNAAAWASRTLPGQYGTICAETAVNVSSATGSVDLMRLATQGGTNVAKVIRSSTGSLQFRSDVSGVVRNTGSTLPGGWNTIRLCGTVGTSGLWDMYLNGAKILDDWNANTGTQAIGRVQIGSNAGETLSINYDDVAVYG